VLYASKALSSLTRRFVRSTGQEFGPGALVPIAGHAFEDANYIPITLGLQGEIAQLNIRLASDL